MKDGLKNEAHFTAPTAMVCLPNGEVLVGDVGGPRTLRALHCPMQVRVSTPHQLLYCTSWVPCCSHTPKRRLG